MPQPSGQFPGVLCETEAVFPPRKTECDIRMRLPWVSGEHCKIEINENKEVRHRCFTEKGTALSHLSGSLTFLFDFLGSPD